MRCESAREGARWRMWQAITFTSDCGQNAAWKPKLFPSARQGTAQLSRPISAMGGKGVFIKEIEDALLAGEWIWLCTA